MDQFPNRIYELRRAKNPPLSQEALGARLGTSKMQVSRYERGEQDLTLEWMRRFASALDCSPADLLTDEDNPMRLREDEQNLFERYRSASDDRKEDLARVAETLIPFRAAPRDKDAA